MTTNTSPTSSTPPVYEPQAVPDPPRVAGVSQELVNVLQKIVENAGALLDVINCSVALLDTKTSMLVTLATLNKARYVQRNTRFRMDEGVAGWVARHREPLIIDDVSLDARFKKLGRLPVGSIACVPLIDAGDFIGTLTVSSPERHAFDTRKQHMLAVFAEQAVLAITNARQAEVARHQAQQLELLLRLSQSITTSLEVDDLYHAILVHIQHLVPSHRAAIYLYNDLLKELWPVAEAIAPNRNEDANHCQAGTANQRRETPIVKVGDVQGEAIPLNHSTSLVAWAATHQHPMIHAEVQSAEMAIPLISKEALYGVLLLQRSTAYTSEELRLTRNLSEMAAAALENITLFQRVRTGQEQWRAIWDASSDGIALLDENACFIEANPAFGQMVGLAPQQITGMEFLELFGCSDESTSTACQQLSHVQAALRDHLALPYIELDLPVKGTVRSIGLSVTPVSLASAPFSLMIARDMTAIRDAARVKANFISMITHELRSPINSINGYLDLALADVAGPLNEQQREFVQRARSGSEHLYTLVEDLLLASRADAGQLRLNRTALQLDEVIASSVEELELTAKDSGVSILTDIPADLPRLYADGVRLQQVLRNLLSNAIRFTPTGGRVTITVRMVNLSNEEQMHTAPAPDQSPQSPQLRQAIAIEVADTGSGIPPEFHERIFERFFQVPIDISGRAGGQGLGLAIVKMIVELHGGHVTLCSTPGEGSTFTVTIPGTVV
jgi:PAS domain S-box-containing protein